VQYSTILNERGTIEDDCLVYRFADRIMMVVNASNASKDFAHVSRHAASYGIRLHDASDEMSLLAVQGPKAAGILQPLTATDLAAIRYYHFAEGSVAGHDAIISRTGYTGEDGFELYVPNAVAVPLWNAIMATGQVAPAGLGARDTLRLEMGMALYGNDIDDTTTPLEAGLGWLVKLGKGDFVGRDALVGAPSGVVCSGTMSPTLGIPIGTCYLPLAATKEGTTFEVEIRGKRVPATVTKPPFYKHASHL
jgi:aminomethyltransferase